jgi:arsenate reductase
MPDPLKVLFVCTGNSARSQMAEGFARHFGQGRVEPYSAGMAPSTLHPHAVQVMQEKGLDISGQQSKAFDWDLARQMDVVVTVCSHANESCPVLPPEVMRMHWPLQDPAAAQGSEETILVTFRSARDQVEVLVRRLLHDLA